MSVAGVAPGHGRPVRMSVGMRRDSMVCDPSGLSGADNRVSDRLLTKAFEKGDAMLRVAVGATGYGLDGFRQTRVQAERTQNLALAARQGARVTAFADVGAIALISADIDAARSWVWGTLADLAVDDESHARLRNTLQVFLRAGTYTATGEQLALHKNSVQYRIRKAEEALGGRIDDRRADLEPCPASLPIPRPGRTSARALRIGCGGLALH